MQILSKIDLLFTRNEKMAYQEIMNGSSTHAKALVWEERKSGDWKLEYLEQIAVLRYAGIRRHIRKSNFYR